MYEARLCSAWLPSLPFTTHQVGYRLPASMLRGVDEGLPFRLSFDGTDDRRDVKQIFSSGTRSTPELT